MKQKFNKLTACNWYTRTYINWRYKLIYWKAFPAMISSVYYLIYLFTYHLPTYLHTYSLTYLVTYLFTVKLSELMNSWCNIKNLNKKLYHKLLNQLPIGSYYFRLHAKKSSYRGVVDMAKVYQSFRFPTTSFAF